MVPLRSVALAQAINNAHTEVAVIALTLIPITLAEHAMEVVIQLILAQKTTIAFLACALPALVLLYLPVKPVLNQLTAWTMSYAPIIFVRTQLASAARIAPNVLLAQPAHQVRASSQMAAHARLTQLVSAHLGNASTLCALEVLANLAVAAQDAEVEQSVRAQFAS